VNLIFLGAETLMGNIVMFGLFAMIFVALKVVFLLHAVCRFFLLNVMFGLLIINTSDSFDITGLMNLISYVFL
jgi:hypothetical protein